jgi:hypothetical protein
MPHKAEIGFIGAVRWLLKNGATVNFGQKDGINHVRLSVRGSLFEGIDFLDVVNRAQDVFQRRRSGSTRESTFDELGSWLKENA